MKESKVRRTSGKIYYQTVKRAKVRGEEIEGTPVRVMPYDQRTVTTTEIADHICHSSSLTQADVVGVLTALGTEISEALLKGNRVSLEGIGTLSISLTINHETASGRQNPQKVVGDDLKGTEIRINKVLFTPSAQLKTQLAKAEFASSGVTSSSEVDYDKVDEWMTEWFSHNFSLTRKQFEKSFGVSTRSANTILRTLVQAGKLKTRGMQKTRFYTPAEGWYTPSDNQQ